MKKFFLTLVLIGIMVPAVRAESVDVRGTEGESIFLRAGEAQWQSLKAGVALNLGDRIATGENAVVQLKFRSELVELGERTSFSIKGVPSHSDGGSLVLELTLGMLKARAALIEIRTPNAAVKVSGFASIWVYAVLEKTYTRLDVFQGQSELEDGEQVRELMLAAGQHLTVGWKSRYEPTAEPFVRGFDAFETVPAMVADGKQAPAVTPAAASAPPVGLSQR